ncbi:MAG: hypothetical protein MUC93_00200 [Bacteroidales bacterium]|jgi:hypothetical protein|nr:hypothetical protein [Bacteroidales bacterium]
MKITSTFFLAIFWSALVISQTESREISFKMEEMTSPQFVTAVAKAGGVCVIPLGIIEKLQKEFYLRSANPSQD